MKKGSNKKSSVKTSSTKTSTEQQAKRKKITQFEILRHNVAGIDVSDNGGMMVAYRVLRTQSLNAFRHISEQSN